MTLECQACSRSKMSAMSPVVQEAYPHPQPLSLPIPEGRGAQIRY